VTPLLVPLLFVATISAPVPRMSPGLHRIAGPRADVYVVGLPVEPIPPFQRKRPVFQQNSTIPFPDTVEIAFLANKQPIRVRVTLQVNGKPLREVWAQHLRKQFDRFDRDHDGMLNRYEVEHIFPAKAMRTLLGGNFPYRTPDMIVAFEDLDRDADNHISYDELAEYYSSSASQIIQTKLLESEDTANEELTNQLFSLLDENHDGKLTRDEMKLAEKILLVLDTDEDDTLSINELVAHRQRPNTAKKTATNTTEAKAVANQLVMQLGELPASIELILTAKYGQKDWKSWRNREPDFIAVATLATGSAVRTVVCQPGHRGLPTGCEIRNDDNRRIVIRVENQFLDLTEFSGRSDFPVHRVIESFNDLYPKDAKKPLQEHELIGSQYQFLHMIFDDADFNGDGYLTPKEYQEYLRLHQITSQLGLTAIHSVRTPSLFHLMDQNNDGRLSIRELRTAFDRLRLLEPNSGDVVTRATLQPSANVRFGFTSQLSSTENFQQRALSLESVRKRNSSTPVWFYKMDRNNDGDISRKEFLGSRERFSAIDTDDDGLISTAEAIAYEQKQTSKK
jgi:Ca2+-binding EF-hand superfamily protein